MPNKNKTVPNIMMNAKADRRLLSHVPDPENIRKAQDRRGASCFSRSAKGSSLPRYPGQRYYASFDVSLKEDSHKKAPLLKGKCIDISKTGMLISFERDPLIDAGANKTVYKLKFKIEPGVLEEGLEADYKINASAVRRTEQDGKVCYAFSFVDSLSVHNAKKKDRQAYITAVVMLFCVVFFIMMLRAESVLYFKFNKVLYFYSIMAASFLLTRYFFGALYKPVPIDPSYTPGVTIIIPCFNEEEWISRTILSCIDQDYPIDKLEVIIVDDASLDGSVKEIQNTVDKLFEVGERFDIKNRIKIFVQEQNAGKREAIARGVLSSKHDIVVFVDSDSFLDPDAIKNLVQPLRDPKTAGVTGRTDVANAYTNGITKMQAVRYYISFRIMKAAEAYFDSVMCLSGPLSCYRKSVVLDNMDNWLNQSFLGQKATFGDDRSITNMVVKKHRTYYQDTAVCSTIAPNTQKVFLKQQMRWKRSWLRESFTAARFMWKKEPVMALFFYIGLLVPMIAPVIVVYNLIYVPIAHLIFPTTFLTGMLMMALLMSFTQLLLRKSSLWLWGLWFVIYYEAVLLWQMPFAWVTFWVTTWGTRMTPSDVILKQQKEAKAAAKKQPPNNITKGT